MKSNQKLFLMLWLKKSKVRKKDGKAPIYVRLTIDGLEEVIALGRYIHPDNWDKTRKIDISSDLDAKTTNRIIQAAEVDLERQFLSLCCQYELVTPTMLKNVYQGKEPLFDPQCKSVQTTSTLLDAYNEFVSIFEKKVKLKLRSEGTLRHWKTNRKKVIEFLMHEYKSTDKKVSEIKYVDSEKFYNYLTLELKEPNSEITAKGEVKKFRQILGNCRKAEIITNNPFEDFKCSGGEKEVQPLEFSQVECIYRKKFASSRLEKIKDCFIVQCFTGFAFQDLSDLTSNHIIRVGTTGELWFSNPRIKTEVQECVPILPIVKEIMEKYLIDKECVNKGCLFPVPSNFNYNCYLKEIADICGIPRELNTHLGRHTFADLILSSGVPLEDLQKMMGHKSIRTTQKYARIRKERIAISMKKAQSAYFTKDGKLKRAS